MLCPRSPGVDAMTPPKQLGDKISKSFNVTWKKNVMSAQMSKVSLVGLGTVLRFERDAWSVVK